MTKTKTKLKTTTKTKVNTTTKTRVKTTTKTKVKTTTKTTSHSYNLTWFVCSDDKTTVAAGDVHQKRISAP